MFTSLCYWLIHLCWWISCHCTSQEHSLCPDPMICLSIFQCLASVSIFVSKVLESYLSCISWCPCITNALEFLKKQENLCQSHHTAAKCVAHDILASEKSLYGIESHFLWKSTCSQILQHFVFVPQLVLKMILRISQSLVKKFEDSSAKTQTIFLIEGPLIWGIGYDVSLISISFSSIFDCCVIFVF